MTRKERARKLIEDLWRLPTETADDEDNLVLAYADEVRRECAYQRFSPMGKEAGES